ncbi:type VII secretion system-associated protein [Nocardia sp. NPDC006630]|uniref:type VII secretion system-associated protein n=1 Tax=Nocardia sp. NPDC006630 TaxID=3157181 RepID=UPI0033BCD452
MDDPVPGVIRQGDWLVLVDPAWDATKGVVASGLMVGGWRRNADATIGPFQPNPGYKPSAATVPTDPIDAILRRIATGADHLGEELTATVRDCIVAVAYDEQGRPLIGTSPDGASCVFVATAEVQKIGLDVPRWGAVVGAKLTEFAPPGVDVFLNPAGAAPFRLARPLD